MAITWGTYKARIARRAHKVLTRTIDDGDVEHWGKAGIEFVENEDAWGYLRVAKTLTMVEDTYEYAWPDDIERFDASSLRYGGDGTHLAYRRRPENIDEELGPHWRTDTTQAGTPDRFVDFGRKFWLAPMPSATFVASNATLYYYAWMSDLYTIEDDDDDATELLIPRRGLEFYVTAALMVGLQQEDDPDWQRFEQTFERQMIRFRSFNPAVRADVDIPVPDFAHNMRY